MLVLLFIGPTLYLYRARESSKKMQDSTQVQMISGGTNIHIVRTK